MWMRGCHRFGFPGRLGNPMRWTILSLTAWICLNIVAQAGDSVSMRTVDGFGLPVGIDNAKRYFKARGFRPNGHLGEDWNGVGGGNTDLGDPVFSTADGLVVYANDFRAGWGNVVLIRHAYLERGEVRFVDSLYGHLDRFFVREGQRVSRGDKIGTIGTAHGRYPAHLHFEIRKDIRVGMFRSQFPRNYSTYFDPTQFVITHQKLDGGKRVRMPINTFPNQSNARWVQNSTSDKDEKENQTVEVRRAVPVEPSRSRSGIRWSVSSPSLLVEGDTSNSNAKPKGSGDFKVDRFRDLRER